MRTSLLLLPGLFLLLTSQCRGDGLQLKACLLECYRCVKTYGKQVYNGKLCADNCALTGGQSIDAKCYPPSKRNAHTVASSLQSECAQLCLDRCAPPPSPYDTPPFPFDTPRGARYSSRDADACVFPCILSNENIVAC